MHHRHRGADGEQSEGGEHRPDIGFASVAERMRPITPQATTPLGDQQEHLVARIGHECADSATIDADPVIAAATVFATATRMFMAKAMITVTIDSLAGVVGSCGVGSKVIARSSHAAQPATAPTTRFRTHRWTCDATPAGVRRTSSPQPVPAVRGLPETERLSVEADDLLPVVADDVHIRERPRCA